MVTEIRNEPEYKIECQDCVAGMKEMGEQSVDVVVTSPPYNLGISYSKYDDKAPREEFLRWCETWITEVLRTLKYEGSFFLNVGASPRDPLLPQQLAILATNAGFKLQNTFHWIKSVSVPVPTDEGILSVGHFKPINSKRFVNDCHEYIFHLTKSGSVQLNRLNLGVPYQDKSNVARWGHTGGRDKRCRGNIWFIPYETIQCRLRDRPHPATFPRQLVKNCLLIHDATPESVVMDPFLGIGTAARACAEFGIRRFAGFDIDREYISVAQSAVAGVLGTDELVLDAG